MDCCYSNVLDKAKEISIINVRPGEKYEGGAIVENNQEIGFDLIKEIRKKIDSENQLYQNCFY